jgi:hypothetical protein
MPSNMLEGHSIAPHTITGNSIKKTNAEGLKHEEQPRTLP